LYTDTQLTSKKRLIN